MKTPPEIVIPKNVELPPVEALRLANGLSVYVIASDEQEVGRLSLVWAAGSTVQDKAFAASSTLNLLAEGSEKFTAQQIAERLDFVGSYFDVSIDRDYAVATFCWLEKFAAPTLEMASQIVLHPAFPEREVEIYTRKRLERLTLERAKPSTKAREAFTESLFGPKHPYGVISPEGEYLRLTRGDMVAFWERFYGADNCFAVCSLSSDPAQKEAVMEFLGRIPTSARSISSPPAPLQGATKDFEEVQNFGIRRTIPIEGAVQSSIRVGRVLFPRRHPDFVGMQVVAAILGGYFGSRLVQNLRERKGYTYGVMAAMVNLRAAGYLAVSTEVAVEATEDAVEQIFVEMERLRVELVGEDELENVRRSMLGEVMRILDGPFGIVDVVIENVQLGWGEREGGATADGADRGDSGSGSAADPESAASESDNYLRDFVRQVEEITPERIRSLAEKYLSREAFTVVVVGG